MRRAVSKETNATRVQDILSQKNETPDLTWAEHPNWGRAGDGGEKDEGGREGEREVEWEERVEKKGGREGSSWNFNCPREKKRSRKQGMMVEGSRMEALSNEPGKQKSKSQLCIYGFLHSWLYFHLINIIWQLNGSFKGGVYSYHWSALPPPAH